MSMEEKGLGVSLAELLGLLVLGQGLRLQQEKRGAEHGADRK